MLRSKFIPPLLRKPVTSLNVQQDTAEPPNKRVKLHQTGNTENEDDDFVPDSDEEGDAKTNPKSESFTQSPTQLKASQGSSQSSLKRPFVALQPVKAVEPKDVSIDGYYNILWRKCTTKKHKTWDGDGVLAVENGIAVLQDVGGKDIGKTRINKPLAVGDILTFSGKDIEIDSLISKGDFFAGRPFMKAQAKAAEPTLTIAPTSFYVKKQFKMPLLSSTIYTKTSKDGTPTPRHDPNAEGALVMTRPKLVVDKKIVDVVVDPFICHHLRPHQREGVAFMYETVMGLRAYEGRGAILADEMGLGKTLMSIALLWTLLKQNPMYGEKPVIQKALIVCPVTLISNWRKEFRKWLGQERIGVFLADGKSNLRDFTHGLQYSVMIVGYERLRNIQDDLKKTKIDIIIADEGHRLKTAQNKSAQAIRALNTPRRIILSGTPLQNDLSEFFIMVDFVNPGLFESYATFKKEFENPIIKSRQPGATKKDKEKGKARSDALASLTKLFVLRRTADVLSKYLPPKTEFVVFCKPTPPQLDIYKAILASPAFDKLMRKPECSLQLITLLKKVCNSPALLSVKTDDDDGQGNTYIKTILDDKNVARLRGNDSASSGKLKVLDRMLKILKETTAEKIVLVSNYTATLDILQNLVTARGYTFLRMDGKTPANKRHELVEKFNRQDAKNAFVFLLSSKAGGAGINLIGASRLVLFDSDWNPANDLQSMARVHRDGQRSHVFIYRMLTTGCLDEKIYQRQITKQGLADSIMDQKSGGSTFSQAELRDLFTLDTETNCNTHDLLGCTCKGVGEIAALDLMDEEKLKENGSDDEDELADLPKLMKASQVNMEQIEKDFAESRTRSKESMKVLLEFGHINTSSLVKNKTKDDTKDKVEPGPEAGGDSEDDMEVIVEDPILRQVIGGSGGTRISFLFNKSS